MHANPFRYAENALVGMEFMEPFDPRPRFIASNDSSGRRLSALPALSSSDGSASKLSLLPTSSPLKESDNRSHLSLLDQEIVAILRYEKLLCIQEILHRLRHQSGKSSHRRLSKQLIATRLYSLQRWCIVQGKKDRDDNRLWSLK